MKVNWKRFLLVFAILQLALFGAGCTASWITAANALVAPLSAAISALFSFIAALENKTVPASVNTAIQKIGADVQVQLANLKTLLSTAASNASAGILSEIQAVINGIVSNLNSILTGFSITDSATIAKITQFVGLGVTALQAILALVPLFGSELAGKLSPLAAELADKHAAAALNVASTTLQETYAAIVAEYTTEAAVNAALDTLPRKL
jgi:hypothetical protein